MKRQVFLIASILTLSASAALAHTGHGPIQGFASGFFHPFGGVDHLLAMISVGLIAAFPGGPGWRAPVAFVLAMLCGFLFQAAGGNVPLAEMLVALSVLGLGVLLFAIRSLPAMLTITAIALFGLVHGYVHGAEAGEAGLAAYGFGFLLATGLLHAGGLVLGLNLDLSDRVWLRQTAGGLVAAVGVVLTVSQIV